MIHVSEVLTTAPKQYKNELNQKIYEAFAALGISRVSFASAEDLGRIIGVLPGASTILGVLMESAQDVKLIIDREVAEAEYLCCPDGTRTGYIKLRTSDVLEKLVPFSGHSYTVI